MSVLRQWGSWLDGRRDLATVLFNIDSNLPEELMNSDEPDFVIIKITRKSATVVKAGDPTYDEPFGVKEDTHFPAFTAWKVEEHDVYPK